MRGGFHRNQLLRKAWKIGSKEAAYYEPLKPKPEDKDLMLPPRAQVSAFGGTGLNEILRSRGIKNVAIAGITTDDGSVFLRAAGTGHHVLVLNQANKPGLGDAVHSHSEHSGFDSHDCGESS